MFSAEQQRKAWTICRSLSGVTYYYNRATKKSQYQMPDCFKTTQQKFQHPEWKQYRTSQGKKFFYNSKTTKSVWQIPQQVKQWRIKMLELQKQQQELLRRKEIEKEELDVSDISTKRFKQLMREKHIDAWKKWDDCCNLCRNDPRWDLVPSMQDRKNIFNEFVAELRRNQDREKKVKLDQLKSNFMKMLVESTYLNSDSKYHKIVILFGGDQRWKDVEEDERQNLFQIHIDSLYQKQREEAREKRKYYVQKLEKEMIQNNISYRTKWDEFKDRFKQNTNFKSLNRIDRLNTFVEFILEAEKRNEEYIENEKMNQGRINRQNFRDLLITKLKQGQLDYKTRWPAFVRNNRHESALIDMMDADMKGSTAHELFEDLMQGIRNNHKTFKTLIKNHFKSMGFKITHQIQQQKFEQELKSLDSFWQLRPIIQDYFYYYFVNKLKNKKNEKRERKDKKVLLMIFEEYHIKPKSNFGDVLALVRKHVKKEDIDDNFVRKFLDKYLRLLESKRENKESLLYESSSEDEQVVKKRKKDDSHRSRSREDKRQRSSSHKRRKSKKRSEEKREKEGKKKMEVEKEKEKEKDRDHDHGEEGEIIDSDKESRKKKSHKSKHKKRKHSDSYSR